METKNQNDNEIVNTDAHNKTLLEWFTPEFIPYPRSITWYVVSGLVFIGLITYAVVTESITMSIVFTLIMALFYFTHNRTPLILDVKIQELGVSYGKKFLSYHAINGFWIVYHDPYIRRLYLRSGKNFSDIIRIELNHQNPAEVRQFLSREIPEIQNMQEPAFDMLTRLLRLH